MTEYKSYRDWLASLSEEEFTAYLALCQRKIAEAFPEAEEELARISPLEAEQLPERLRDVRTILQPKEKVVEMPQWEEAEAAFEEAVGFRSDAVVSKETMKAIRKKIAEMRGEDAEKD